MRWILVLHSHKLKVVNSKEKKICCRYAEDYAQKQMECELGEVDTLHDMWWSTRIHIVRILVTSCHMYHVRASHVQ